MSRLADTLYALAIVLWVGALWAIGFIAAPVLFQGAGSSMLAGTLAGQMFAIVAWLGMGCAVYLMLFMFFHQGLRAFRQWAFWLVLLMLVLTLVGHFGITPVIEKLRPEVARDVVAEVIRSRFHTWHGIASLLWLIQCVAGLGLASMVIKR